MAVEKIQGANAVPVLILAGGLGTRISEESQFKPKPMIEVGGIPILVHIMRHYYAYGFNDFVICAGYRAIEIKKYFMYYQALHNDLDIDHRHCFDESWKFQQAGDEQERWRVRVLDTGLHAMTGARVARALQSVNSSFENFALTYGDGLSDVDLAAEWSFHKQHGSVGTVLGVKNLARYGELSLGPDCTVQAFLEKPQQTQGFINGGFFFFKREFERSLSTDSTLVLENEPLTELAVRGELRVFQHMGFWQAMDTLRDKQQLERLWESGHAPWTIPARSGSPELGATL